MTELTRIKRRLDHWYGLADARHIWAGKAWYREAHQFALEITCVYDIPLYKVVGVIAAISPSIAWPVNKKQAEDLCRAYADNGILENVIVSTYGKQAMKARDILRTAKGPIDTARLLGTRAFKTEAFFWNILDVTSRHVTIDQHIIAAAGWEKKWVQSARHCYTLIESAIADLAVKYKMKSYEFQAVIWITYKDLTNPKIEEEIPF